MKFLLDTDICIYLINERPKKVTSRFKRYPIGGVGVSSVTAAELAFGITKTGSARNRAALEKFLLPLEVAAFDFAAAQVYGEMRADLEQRGEPIGPLDTLIAAHALSLGVTLVSNNMREFKKVRDLRIENWAT